MNCECGKKLTGKNTRCESCKSKHIKAYQKQWHKNRTNNRVIRSNLFKEEQEFLDFYNKGIKVNRMSMFNDGYAYIRR